MESSAKSFYFILSHEIDCNPGFITYFLLGIPFSISHHQHHHIITYQDQDHKHLIVDKKTRELFIILQFEISILGDRPICDRSCHG